MANRSVDTQLQSRGGAFLEESGHELGFSREAEALRTPFRSHALHLLYWAALSELGRRLRSASVSMWSEPGEADSEILLLSILADTDAATLDTVRESMLTSISKEAASWSEEERQDYSGRTYFELESLQA